MKRTLVIILFLVAVIYPAKQFAWDNEIAKYFPLQVGNKWVYKGTLTGIPSFGTFYHRIAVTGIVDSLGKRYYKLESSYTRISGNSDCNIWNIGRYMRIDSTTMNIYSLGYSCDNYEVFIDSLRSKINEVAYKCPQQNNYRSECMDTANFIIFGNSHPSKRFWTMLGPGIETRYVKGIGIATYWWSYQMMNCRDTLKGCVINGVLYGDTNTLVGINQIISEIPQQFSLSQNYPNPFNPTTNIKFDISKAGFVKLTVFDVLGKEVQTLLNEQLSPGTYNYDFDASHLPSGIYYYKLEANGFIQTKKMVLIK